MIAPYDEIKAISWSSLRHMATSPLLYKWRLDHPREDTATLIVGSAIHCAILEPDKFSARYAVYAEGRRGKAWDEWQAEHHGVASLKPAELERINATAKAVRGHKVASRILSACRKEEPLTWVDPVTGLACKGRVDAISPVYVADLKSARDVDPHRFTRHAAAMLYFGQLAWYGDGAIVAGRIPRDAALPYIVAAQSDEPYDVAVYQLSPEAMIAGRTLYCRLLQRLLQCTEANWWPGVAPDLEYLSLPPWAEGQSISTDNEEF